MRDVDFDRLADFVSGALDGTVAQDEVRDLIAREPAWQDAVAHVASALDSVDDDLRALSAYPSVMPPEVVSRLETAIGRENSSRGFAPQQTVRRSEVSSPFGTRWLGRLGLRWPVVAAVTAAVTATVALVGVSVVVALPRASTESATSSVADAAGQGDTSVPSEGLPSQGVSALSGPLLIASGGDYAADTVASVADLASAAGSSSNPSDESASDLDGESNPAPTVLGESLAQALNLTELDRLADATALDSCLSSVVARHGGQVTLVDYARFDGVPALILVVLDTAEAAGERLVVVVGASCGLSDSDPDERHVTVAR